MAHDLKTDAKRDFEAEIEALGLDIPIAVALTDLDGFAGVNERYGRKGGDAVLASWERTLKGSLPKHAIVARLGGDEYAVALPDTSAESALIILEEIRAHFSSRPAADAVPERLAVTAGIAARPPHAREPGDLLKAAEEALFRAKREGSNRTAIYVEEKMVLKSNYYSKAALDRLAKLSDRAGRTEASLLREALDDLFTKHRDLV